jgi:tetratricopeptide (TPR) repeat protein
MSTLPVLLRSLRNSFSGGLAAGLFLIAASQLTELHAQSTPDGPKKEISEKISSELGPLRTFIESKDYAGGLALVERLIPLAPAESFDLFVLSQVQAQILLTQGRLTAAIPAMERANNLGERYPQFTDTSSSVEQLYVLAQLYYQRGEESKVPALRLADLERSLSMINRWFERSPAATGETRLFAASLLYNLATSDSQKTDRPRIEQAIEQANQGLLLSVKPSGQLYLILLASYQQIGDYARAAELLEVMASRPDSTATTWSQLQSIYLTAAAESKDPAYSFRQNIRALLTIERAQARGFLTTPKDNYTRVAVLFNIQQFSLAASLLEKGLTDGTLENQKRNWELLASAYQQTSQEDKAAATLERALKAFPSDAALEFSLAQFYYNAGRIAEAYARGQSARAQPSVEKPGQVSLYLAYLAFELQRYDEAAKWIDDARPRPEVTAASLDPLAKAVTEAIREREALKANKS